MSTDTSVDTNRCRAWKQHLQRFADRSRLTIQVTKPLGQDTKRDRVRPASPDSPVARAPSRVNDRHFQSAINGLKRLLESVHAGSVVNIEDAVNLRHVPTEPSPKFSLCNSLLLHRVIQLDLWHGQQWNIHHYPSS